MSIYVKSFRTILYVLPLISSTFLSSSAMAKIPPTAFKGISRYFKDRSFDPTLGQMALDVGEIHNIRFDGNFEGGMLNGERSYIKDHSQSDAVWALEKLLFPSPAGHLTTETDSNSNFAKLVNDSQVISKLANYAHGLRRHANNKEAHPPKLETTRSEILLFMASDTEKELVKAWDAILESELNDENLKELKSLTKEKELLEKKIATQFKEASKNKSSMNKSTEKNKEPDLSGLAELKKNFAELKERIGSRKKELSTRLLNKIKEEPNLKALNAEKKVTELMSALNKTIDETLKQDQGTAKVKHKSAEVSPDGLQFNAELIFKGKYKAANEVVNAIQNAIQQESAEKIRGLYPQYTTEQILTAFLCQKFNTQSDLIGYIEGLDEDIVDKALPLPDHEDLLTKEDLEIFSKKEKKRIDEMYALSQSGVFYQSVPFQSGVPPLSNGAAQFYDRKSHTLISGKTFQDCAERVALQLLSILFYNPLTQQYDLSAAIQHTQKNSPENPYFKNVVEFFTQYTPAQSNSGDLKTRSEANKMFGDLNASDENIKEAITIDYNQGNNELKAGSLRMMKVFQKLFSLPLGDIPNSKEEQKAWLKESLATMFKTLSPNPDRNYEFDLRQLQAGNNDLIGDIKISGSQEEEPLFEFDLNHSDGHAHTKSIIDYQQENAPKYEVKVPEDTTLPTLEVVKLLFKEKASHLFYQLFSEALTDNDSRIRFLEKIYQLEAEHSEPSSLFMQNIPTISTMLDHVLEGVGWEDPAVTARITGILDEHARDEGLHREILKHVGGLNFEGLGWSKILQESSHFPKLKHLWSPPILEDSFDITPYPNLLTLDLKSSAISKIEGLEHAPHLEKLVVSNTRSLQEIKFTKPMHALKTIVAKRSGITRLEGLEHAPHLEKLVVSNTSSLQEIKFTEPMHALTTIVTKRSGITRLEGLEQAPHLETLVVNDTDNLEEIKFIKPMNALKTIEAEGSAISKVEGLEHAPNLETLAVRNAENLEEINFIKLMDALKTIGVEGSGITKIEGLEHIPNLETFVVKKMGNLEEIKFTKPMNALKTVDASNSKIRSILGLEHAPNLEILVVNDTHNLQEIKMTKPMHALKRIDAKGSAILKVEGLEHVLNLERFNISGTRHLKALEFKTHMNALKTVDASNCKIRSVLGLEHVPNLEIFDISGTRHLKALEFKTPMNALKTVKADNLVGLSIVGLQHLTSNTSLSFEKTKQITAKVPKGFDPKFKTTKAIKYEYEDDR